MALHHHSESVQDKVRKVMMEFRAGRLRSGSGRLVKGKEEALAIAMSKAGIGKRSGKR